MWTAIHSPRSPMQYAARIGCDTAFSPNRSQNDRGKFRRITPKTAIGSVAGRRLFNFNQSKADIGRSREHHHFSTQIGSLTKPPNLHPVGSGWQPSIASLTNSAKVYFCRRDLRAVSAAQKWPKSLLITLHKSTAAEFPQRQK